MKVEYGVESPNNSSHGDEEVKEEIKQMQVKTSPNASSEGTLIKGLISENGG